MVNSTSLPIPAQESARLQSILNYEVLDTANDKQLDELTVFTATMFRVPIAVISIVDHRRQWFKSSCGLNLPETDRQISFCQYTIMSDEVFEVENALLDERFVDNPLVTQGSHICFYCGAPLINAEGYKMGSLAVMDYVPRKFDDFQKNTLQLLAQQVINFFELNMKKKELDLEKRRLEEKVVQRTLELEQKVIQLRQKDERLTSVNDELDRFIYKATHDLLGPLKTLQGITHLAIGEVQVENVRHYLRLSSATVKKMDQALVNLIKVVTIKEASDFSVIDWNEVARKGMLNARKRVEGKMVTVHLDNTVDKEVVSDPLLLEISMEELFVNSMQYNQNEQVVIDIHIREMNGRVVISIKDNGIGVREEGKAKIFEMFYKESTSKGNGLGLYITKKAIDSLQGRVYCESGKNTGTTFFLEMPFQRVEAE